METYVANLCRQLSERGHQCDVATLDYIFKTKQQLPAYQEIDGTDVIRLPSLGTARYFLAPRLLDLMPRYDLVHVHGVDFFIDLLGTFKGVHNTPVVLSTHGGFFHTSWFPSFKQAYFKTITRNSLKGVDRVIASSQKDADLFSQVTENISLVDNGIDYQKFAQVEKKIEGQSLVFVGRISKNKRVDRLLDVFSRVRDMRPHAQLKIIGPDWEDLQKGLEEHAEKIGLGRSVTFTGVVSQEEMLAALATARLFVSASEYEAFGLSTVEAMATGTVPVVNDIPAFADIIDDGESGFLADYADPGTAAEILRAALDLEDGRLASIGAAAKKTAAGYDWNLVADSIVSIYEEVTAGRKTAPEGPLEVLGVEVDRVSRHDALEQVDSFLTTPGCKQIVTLNPEYVMLAGRNHELLKMINRSELCVPDGMGIVWASRLLGEPLPDRITGTGLLPEICGIAAENGLSVFFLGGKPGVAELAAHELSHRYPGLKVAGTSSADPGIETDDETVRMINDSGADILAVAYGCPKQDFWIGRNREKLLNVRVAIGVGGAFDFISGMIPRAPRIMRKAGMEWLFRLWMEPSRAKRMTALPHFGWLVMRSRKK
jgi:alpha-1,3-mannosyltransferase